jgi:hypothetical protein
MRVKTPVGTAGDGDFSPFPAALVCRVCAKFVVRGTMRVFLWQRVLLGANVKWAMCAFATRRSSNVAPPAAEVAMIQRCSPGFERLLHAFRRDETDAAASIIFGIWSDFRLAYFNVSWQRFAQANGAPPQLSSAGCLGTSVLDVCGSALRPFYRDWYTACLAAGGEGLFPYQHEYECSSADLYRRFAMTLYPLGQREGLLVVNSLIAESAHDECQRPSHDADRSNYSGADGLIHQCSHCRKVRHPREKNRWDWVPNWVRSSPIETSHGICPNCFDFYYPEARQREPSLDWQKRVQ